MQDERHADLEITFHFELKPVRISTMIIHAHAMHAYQYDQWYSPHLLLQAFDEVQVAVSDFIEVSLDFHKGLLVRCD